MNQPQINSEVSREEAAPGASFGKARLASPTAIGLLQYAAAALLVGALLIWTTNVILGSTLLIAGCCLISLLFASEIGVYLTLGGFGYMVLNPITSNWQWARSLTWYEVWLTLVFLVFAALCFRYLELAKYHRIAASVERPFIFSAGHQPSIISFRVNFFGGRWWLLPIAAGIAILVVTYVPAEPAFAKQFWISSLGARIILMFGLMFLTWLLSCALWSMLARFRLDPNRASIQVRSQVAAELWHDQAAVERRKSKLRGTTTGRTNTGGTNTGGTNTGG